MIYKKIAPSVLLKPFVETFYVWETSINQDIISKIESPPSGFASMVFNYGEAYKMKRHHYYCLLLLSFLAGQTFAQEKLWTETDRQFTIDQFNRTRDELVKETENLTPAQWAFHESARTG